MKSKHALMAFLLLTACAGTPLAPPDTPPTQPEAPLTGWTTDYNRFIETNVTVAMLEMKQVPAFCLKYKALSSDKKREFWGVLFKAISKQESSWKRTLRYPETSLGVDSVTKLPVQSEGLLQLSYSDTRRYPCPQISWAEDKALEPTDPKKTIFNANYNLYCGVQIVDKLLRAYPSTSFEGVMGKYWSVMRPLKNGSPRQSYLGVLALVKKEYSEC